MLKIKATQYEQLGDHAFQMFVARTAATMRDHWPDTFSALGEQRSVVAVKASIEAALRLGFETEYDAGRFVLLAFAFKSLGFANEAWATAHISAELPARERMNKLFEAALVRLPA
jgi:hypothetical protein